MTYEEMLAFREGKMRKRPSDEEHRIQCACVRWFRFQYPSLSGVLFAIPNGGRRDAATGARMKEEGVVAGVSDLILLRGSGPYGALCIEMKTPSGRQSETQKKWQRIAEENGAKYVVCRSLDDFMKEIEEYLKSNTYEYKRNKGT